MLLGARKGKKDTHDQNQHKSENNWMTTTKEWFFMRIHTPPHYPRLCGCLGHRNKKKIWGTSFPEFSPEKFPLSDSNLSHGEKSQPAFPDNPAISARGDP